jgi:tetratricopeptide (TPR) repeat protein
MVRRFTFTVASSSILLALAGAAHAHGVTGLGKVDFPNSCSPAVQEKVQAGVAMLHSFYYSATRRTFEEIAAQDNGCVIAAWGFASILMGNPLAGAGASPKDAEAAQAAIDKGRRMGGTQRERDYLEAVAAYYQDFGKRSERERQVARAKAYETLAANYPDDDEAQTFYAVYLAGTQLQSDQTYGAWLKAAGILEQQFRKHPQHPGVAHYLIHSYDAPPIAQKGMGAARRYAEIAPDAPHALHMPSHIFTRVGEWADSAATNLRSAESALKAREPDQAAHALDYAAYAYLQLGRDSEARKVTDEVLGYKGFNANIFTGSYAAAAMPARYALERADWKAATRLEPRQDKFVFTVAMTHYARALGAARSGDSASAKQDIERIAALGEQLKEAKNAYWGGEVEVMRLTAVAWAALAQRNADAALDNMRRAADLEDKSDKHIVTPARLLPARELLGDMLLELKRPAEALKEYEASQVREPNRLRGYYGAGLAASQSGQHAKAKQHFGKLVAMAGKGEPRPEVAAARAWLSGH